VSTPWVIVGILFNTFGKFLTNILTNFIVTFHVRYTFAIFFPLSNIFTFSLHVHTSAPVCNAFIALYTFERLANDDLLSSSVIGT